MNDAEFLQNIIERSKNCGACLFVGLSSYGRLNELVGGHALGDANIGFGSLAALRPTLVRAAAERALAEMVADKMEKSL